MSAEGGGSIDSGRRRFLLAGGGLTLALVLRPRGSRAAEPAGAAPQQGAPPPPPEVAPDAFVRLGTDGRVTIICKHLEMGQGTYTGIATLIAEELDVSLDSVTVEGAPADAKRYGNLAWGGAVQGTGGSSAMAAGWQQMRKAGAQMRMMLLQAAAAQYKVPVEELHTTGGGWISIPKEAAQQEEKSDLIHLGPSRVHYALFAEAAAKLPVPQDVKLKTPDQWRLIGKDKIHRVDNKAKTDGSAIFTQDIQLPGMKVAVIAHPPRFGGKLAKFDDSKARKSPGVVDVYAVPGLAGVYGGGVAVLARDTWSALRGRAALEVQWDDSAAVRISSAEQTKQYRELATRPGSKVLDRGDHGKAFEAAARTLEAEYEVPYLAHASMEPLNCVVQINADGAELWNGEQFHTIDQASVAAALGFKPEQVQLHQVYAGGSFGRRANPKSDYLLEAVAVAKLARERKIEGAVKLVWTREDDTSGGYYRPHTLHALKAALDKSGKVTAWWQRIVGQSIAKGSPFEAMMVRDGVDATSVEGVADLPYAIPAIRAELHSPDPGVPVQWWRSVGHTHTGFAVEAFVDEIAGAAEADPLAFRRALLHDHPRDLGVLELAAAKAGWGTPLKPRKDGERRGRGIAVHKSFDTYVAQVAEVCVQADGSFKVERVVCAVDCGIAINPDVIRAQMEGGIGYGLSAALHGAITLADGIVEQRNFHDYRQLRIHEMPAVEVHIVASTEKPTGVGEPGTAVIAPALVNALFAATGVRVRRLPVDPAQLRAATA